MQIQRYVSKISGPLLDRIDIHIDVPAVKFKELASDTPAENSAAIREPRGKGSADSIGAFPRREDLLQRSDVAEVDSDLLCDRFGVEGIIGERDNPAGVIGSGLRSHSEGEPDVGGSGREGNYRTRSRQRSDSVSDAGSQLLGLDALNAHSLSIPKPIRRGRCRTVIGAGRAILQFITSGATS
jgi:Magnesium chelatase, subunit ChlI